MNQNTNKPFKGLHTDNDPSLQPESTYRYALNAVNENKEGNQTSVSNEGSNYSCTTIPDGFKIIGDKYLEDNTSVVFLVNPSSGRQQIGLLQKDNVYETVVDTAVLEFNIQNQIDCTYRLRRGYERVIYWVDGLHRPRSFNLNRVHNYYTQAYKNYLEAGGDPNTYPGDKWDADSFNLIKTYDSIPYFYDMEVLDYGNIKPGSYNFAIQYLDDDLNPTEWINVSNTVNIYNDSLYSSYPTIRGSYNVNEFQDFPEANKSIKLSIANLDESYPYYRIAIIQANAGTGTVNNVLLSPQQSSNVGTYIYSGNDGALEQMDVNEIRFELENILKPKHIEQLENRLILANTEGNAYNWCEFQEYASKIDTMCVFKDVLLNNIQSEPNVKNGKSTFFFRGYMPGEVYSFGIVYIMKDNTLSPVFHIPGKAVNNVTSNMEVYYSNYNYPDVHNCITNNYWGVDASGNQIRGEKVRHHKFPTRQQVNKPLVSTLSTPVDFYRHKLKLKITLADPVNKPYPVDGGGDPLVIDYQANYQLAGSPISEYTNTLTESQLGTEITILNTISTDPNYVVEINPPDYMVLDPACELMTDYMVVGDETFIIEYIYEVEVDNSVNDISNSQIFGIQFNDIEVPHPDVIGFYIVRNEVFDDDKIIIDNCIVGPNVVQDNYRAFTHITPAFPTSKFDSGSVWFFSPEVNFNRKLIQFNDLDPQGYYETKAVYRPSDLYFATDENGEDLEKDRLIGVYVEDVQVGTSYNPEVHKKREKDSDGFSLQAGYKTTYFNYVHTVLPLERHEKSFILDATANSIEGTDNYYNVSVDNRIAMTRFMNPINTAIFKNNQDFNISYRSPSCVVKGSRLIYASMRRGYYDGNTWHDMETAYQDFLTRAYYKEHMRPVYFNGATVYDGFEVYNGDVQISSMNLFTSLFRQIKIQKRKTKGSWWRYLLGAILVVVGVVVGIFTGGAGAAAGIAAAVAIVAAGAMFIHSGIKLDKAISMWTEDYSKGLLKCVEDAVVLNYLGSSDESGTGDPNYLDIGDDCLQWFCDRGANLYIESRVPFGLRTGLSTTEATDFIDAPDSYSDSVMYNYVTEKLTYPDREQGGGRLYRGVANAEVYSMNPDYSRFNKEKSYIHLPTSYDCCYPEGIIERFPTRVWYSRQSFQEEKTDNYRAFLPNNYRDVEGENGEITDLYKIGNSLFIHTSEALWQLPQNNQERVNNELTTFIGTGEFFSIPPRKVLDDNLGSGGSNHKWATIKTKYGVFFVSEIENKVYLHSEGVKDLTVLGLRNWFENNLKSNLIQQFYDATGYELPVDNNPANGVGVGYLSCYDTRYERVLFTKRDFKVRDGMAFHVGSMEYTTTSSPSYTTVGYNPNTGRFHLGVGSGSQMVFYKLPIERFEDYPQHFENKSWTLSYSLHTNTWVSYHSYLPNYYIHNQSNFYSFIYDSNSIWKHNMENNFQTFYGNRFSHILEFISVSNPLMTRIWEDIILLTNAKRWNSNTESFIDERYITHNKITLSNSRQCSGELDMIVKDLGNPQDYLFEQTTNNPGEITIDRNERNWSINNLRDCVVDYTTPFFSRDWLAIQSQYPIDKVVNTGVINFNKDWYELESFRDKYLNIRLKFDNFADVSLTTQFSIETENNSER